MRQNREMTRREYEEFLRFGNPYSPNDAKITRLSNILTAVKRLSIRERAFPSEERIYYELTRDGMRVQPDELLEVTNCIRYRREYKKWEKE
ncbi:hypothetical protein HYW75_04590 [Candidatus Pacearchaeota archaeon]|nr:hypothetical protein [Candidatus Pacearchaeota archaeon]